MIKRFSFNALTGNFDLVGVVPELNPDPGSPAPGDVWVRSADVGFNAGDAMGVMGLTYSGPSYSLSYKTESGGIVRTELS